MSDTLDLFADSLREIAAGPHVGSFDAVTEALMRRLSEKGLTLEHLASRQMMNRSVRTLEAHAREYGLAFPDYVPAALRKRVVLQQFGDFYEVIGDDAHAVAKTLGIVVSKRKRDGEPMCGVPAHALTDCVEKLKAAFYIVKIVKAKRRKAKANG